MNGAEELIEHLVLEHGAAPGVESAEGLLVETTCCFASCDLGPNVEIDGVFYEGVTTQQLDALLAGEDVTVE
jgi:NADH:ubiquinone oxidoreductase subunit E